MNSGHAIEDCIRSWDAGDAAALLAAMDDTFPSASTEARASALECIAREHYSPTSMRAAETLCQLAGLGNPCDTAYRLYNDAQAELSEPQWFVWIAGYSYNWVCNSGLAACYFEFGEQQFADRVRVYDAIGATQAAQVMRDADQAFGPLGPAASLEGRQAQITDALDAKLDELSRRFWACGDEIYTRAYLYALAHAEDFAGGST